MTLLKRFMAWGIGLTRLSRNDRSLQSSAFSDRPTRSRRNDALNFPKPKRRSTAPPFRSIAWRLLLSYLAAMIAVFGILAVVMYQFFAYSLYQRLDKNLALLADAAAHSLPDVLADQAAVPERLPRTIDNDGDLDIPWQDLQQDQQSVEWFDANQRLAARVGKQFPQHPPGTRFQTWQQDEIRTLTVPVYTPATRANQMLQGYVRVSESIGEEKEELEQLLTGIAWGGAIGVILIGMSGWWLTRRSLHPIEQSFRQLQQFTADASHELRSPLTAVRTAVEVMQSHPERIHPADVKKLSDMTSATHQMTHLVEDLLLLARADADTTYSALSPLPLPLDELLEDLLDAMQPQAQAKNIQLIITELSQVKVTGDAAQLKRLFRNLLDNALQYTPQQGTVSITSEELGSSVFIRIQDTGIGIAPDQLPRVFDRFWRADQARSHRAGGSGLGLAIAQSIACAHGGDISVTSQLGIGSCFQVELPFV